MLDFYGINPCLETGIFDLLKLPNTLINMIEPWYLTASCCLKWLPMTYLTRFLNLKNQLLQQNTENIKHRA
ncbi:hypothetical protein Hanom_Chr11g01037541 [Helianthus anomalus]